MTACPDCGADVGPEDSFCAACGENLDAHRESDELMACPDCGADVDSDDSFCAGCGEDLDAHRESDGSDQTDSDDTGSSDATASEDVAGEDSAETADAAAGDDAPDSLVLETRGEEIAVADGDTVGRELRRILTESGSDEDQAVRIHREHVRFVRENGQFYVVDLGRNPTRLNDERMEQGDREPIGPGDELHLSGVVTLAVRAP